MRKTIKIINQVKSAGIASVALLCACSKNIEPLNMDKEELLASGWLREVTQEMVDYEANIPKIAGGYITTNEEDPISVISKWLFDNHSIIGFDAFCSEYKYDGKTYTDKAIILDILNHHPNDIINFLKEKGMDKEDEQQECLKFIKLTIYESQNPLISIINEALFEKYGVDDFSEHCFNNGLKNSNIKYKVYNDEEIITNFLEKKYINESEGLEFIRLTIYKYENPLIATIDYKLLEKYNKENFALLCYKYNLNQGQGFGDANLEEPATMSMLSFDDKAIEVIHEAIEMKNQENLMHQEESDFDIW